jgi:hypothetical protein
MAMGGYQGDLVHDLERNSSGRTLPDMLVADAITFIVPVHRPTSSVVATPQRHAGAATTSVSY